MSKKYKKHTLEDRLKYMKMIEEGYSVKYIHKHYGICSVMLECLWMRYQAEGVMALVKKQSTKLSVDYRIKAISEFEENKLSLREVLVKYDISRAAFTRWRKLYALGGEAALIEHRIRGRPPKDMARPKKKTWAEMTELERLQQENMELKTEIALLKKVRALVEGKNARLREIGRRPSKN
ncbi:MAG: helix-turn-helix domain-containing protein [Paludibacteraceae bacterium]|nr:helix-turn-helix domain-containing protein [Paludibacteraceae bacterium]